MSFIKTPSKLLGAVQINSGLVFDELLEVIRVIVVVACIATVANAVHVDRAIIQLSLYYRVQCLLVHHCLLGLGLAVEAFLGEATVVALYRLLIEISLIGEALIS